MNRVFHTGIVLAVVVHMVCGCCVHHAHAHAHRSQSSDRVLTAEVGCTHHHEHNHHESVDSDGHLSDTAPIHHGSSEHQHCDGEPCVFTRPDSDDSSEWFHAEIIFLPANDVLVQPARNPLEVADAYRWYHTTPIRLHLLNQAFLL